MPRYALVKSGSFVENRTYQTKPDDIPHKGVQWLPCDPVLPPSFDPALEKVTGPTYTVGASSVTEVWTKVSLSAQEISDAKDAAVNGLNGAAYPALAKVLLNHENRIRPLEAKGAITMAQFKAGVKALL